MKALNRQRYLLDYTLSSLLRCKGKHLALLSVHTLIIFLLASVMLFTHALMGEIADAMSAAPEIVLQRIDRLKQTGKTVIVSSHDPTVFDSPVVDCVISLRDGLLEGE